jgi:hypothetical protein
VLPNKGVELIAQVSRPSQREEQRPRHVGLQLIRPSSNQSLNVSQIYNSAKAGFGKDQPEHDITDPPPVEFRKEQQLQTFSVIALLHISQHDRQHQDGQQS